MQTISIEMTRFDGSTSCSQCRHGKRYVYTCIIVLIHQILYKYCYYSPTTQFNHSLFYQHYSHWIQTMLPLTSTITRKYRFLSQFAQPTNTTESLPTPSPLLHCHTHSQQSPATALSLVLLQMWQKFLR